MMDVYFYTAQFVIDVGLLMLIFTLRREVKQLRGIQSPPLESPETFTSDELRALRGSLASLVEEIENFTEEHRREISERTDEFRAILQRLEHTESRLSERTAERAAANETARPNPVLRISPGIRAIQHPQADRIQQLHASGKSVDDIARELQLGKGEVQLVLRLS